MGLTMEVNFNFGNSLCDFSEERNKSSTNAGIDYNAFWHELGHLFGLVLAEVNGNKLAGVKKNIIKKNDQKIFTEGDDFKPINKTNCDIDFYGQQNMCYEKVNEQRLTLKLNDANKSLYYFSYLLLGGIFQLFISIDNPTVKDFEDCYTNDKLNDDIKGISGRAENDWCKLRRLASLKQLDLSYFKNLRFDMYHFLKNNKIFEHLKPKVEKLYGALKNIEIIEGHNLMKSEEILTEIFIEIPKFASEYQSIIVEKYIKILKYRKAENCIKE